MLLIMGTIFTLFLALFYHLIKPSSFVIFDHYRIPKDNLLNKIGDVTEDGRYVTSIKDPNKRHGASLGTLSIGRTDIVGMGSSYLCRAITIAIRYAAVRKQFGADDSNEEMPILEYQSHVSRTHLCYNIILESSSFSSNIVYYLI